MKLILFLILFLSINSQEEYELITAKFYSASNTIEFNDKKYVEIRKKMLEGRSNNSFCKYCDFNDVGTRKHLMENDLKGNR